MDYKILLIRIASSFIMLFTLLIFLFLFKDKINYLINIIYIFILLEIIINFSNRKLYLIALLYIIFSCVFFNLYFNTYYNYEEFLLLIIIIISFDTFSYILGSIFGKNKIFINISKNKTYEGLLLGIISSLSISYVLNLYLNIFTSFLFVIFFILTIIFSFFGDILESILKRKSKLKDSSNLIPGHGGFFDRFDSFVFCAYYLIIFKIFI
tara:strand:+ start:156 stop:785 length:630 start_codon:yes stop_codon:yes gene_type:complete